MSSSPLPCPAPPPSSPPSSIWLRSGAMAARPHDNNPHMFADGTTRAPCHHYDQRNHMHAGWQRGRYWEREGHKQRTHNHLTMSSRKNPNLPSQFQRVCCRFPNMTPHSIGRLRTYVEGHYCRSSRRKKMQGAAITVIKTTRGETSQFLFRAVSQSCIHVHKMSVFLLEMLMFYFAFNRN